MPKFRKKPIVIEAWQFIMNSPYGWPPVPLYAEGGEIFIETLEGNMKVSEEDWIIKGIAGEFYPCKPDIFKATYEAVEAPNETTN